LDPQGENLVDSEKEVFDPLSSVNNLILFKEHLLEVFREGRYEFGISESNLVDLCLPQLFYFPEFVKWYMQNYFESQRVIKSHFGKVLVSISPKSIIQMFNLPSLEGQNLIPLNPDNAITLVNQMILKSKANQFNRF
jgi:hypothetical protein